MIPFSRSTQAAWRVLLMSLLAAIAFPSARGQQACSPSAGERPVSTTDGPLPMNWSVEQDHQNMMDQLGIRVLRLGPSGDEKAPKHANYDESTANPFPDLPDALTLKSGKRVTTAAEWWHQRRPEIVEDFERQSVRDRKSTRLNSSHTVISYAVFCLKKKKTITQHNRK